MRDLTNCIAVSSNGCNITWWHDASDWLAFAYDVIAYTHVQIQQVLCCTMYSIDNVQYIDVPDAIDSFVFMLFV